MAGANLSAAIANYELEQVSYAVIDQFDGPQTLISFGDASAPKVVKFPISIGRDFTPRVKPNGSVEVSNDQSGEVIGSYSTPWARDASGKPIPTSFTVTGDHQTGFYLIQRVEHRPSNAFPVVADPDWMWWAGTAALCAVEIAPLIATTGVAVMARFPRLISAIDRLKSTPKLAAAIQRVGGTKEAAVALFKGALNNMRDKLPNAIKSRFPQQGMTPASKAAFAALWAYFSNNIWDLLGFGNCTSLVRGS